MVSKQKHPDLEIDSDFDLIDVDNLANLVDAFRAYVNTQRSPTLTEDEDNQTAIMQAVCLTLIVGPPEIGVTIHPSPLRERAYTFLSDVRTDAISEASACYLWLSCADGERRENDINEFVSLARKPLWEPVQALVYRALAYYGQRKTLAELLPREEPQSLVEADAWLEANNAIEGAEHLAKLIASMSSNLLSRGVCESWITLLLNELVLSQDDHTEKIEEDLLLLTSYFSETPPRTYGEAEFRHISARATAALACSRLARWLDIEDLLTSPAGQSLPAWERMYLRGLSLWQSNDCDRATSLMQTALEYNPYQTPIRLSLAILLAVQSPEEALEVLKYEEPTIEMLITQAALLARLGRYRKAKETLKLCDDDNIYRSEPSRYSWTRGREQFRKQKLILHTAIAEHMRDFESAAKIWQATNSGGIRNSLLEARKLYAANRELTSLVPGREWRRSILKNCIERGVQEIGAIPLIGNDTYFRAKALADISPERAAKDFQNLIKRPQWVEAEQKVGGGRLIVVGDALLHLDKIDDAFNAYQLANNSPHPELNERLAVAYIYKQVRDHANPKAILDAVAYTTDLVLDNPYPHLIAVLGLLIAGERNAALSCLDEAEERGAPGAICRSLRTLCTITSELGTIPEEDLTVLRLPKEVKAILRLICGEGSEPYRIEDYVNIFREKWITQCPTDPRLVARWLLTTWCEEGKWDQALDLANELVQSDDAWAKELAILVQVRHALNRASQGELGEAELELISLETYL